MRYVILKAEVVEGSLAIFGLSEIRQKSTGIIPLWVDFKEAKTDCVNPDKCDLLSFGDERSAKELLENTGMVDDETITYIGVNA